MSWRHTVFACGRIGAPVQIPFQTLYDYILNLNVSFQAEIEVGEVEFHSGRVRMHSTEYLKSWHLIVLVPLLASVITSDQVRNVI